MFSPCFGVEVGEEFEFGHAEHVDAFGKLDLDETAGLFDGFEAGGLFGGGALHGEADVDLARTGREENLGDGDGGDARVVEFVVDDFAEFVAQHFGYALGATGFHKLLNPFCPGADERAAGDAVGVAFDGLQDLFGADLFAGDGDGGKARALPGVVEIGFGDGDVVAGAEAVLQAFDQVALVLEGVGAFDMEFQSEYADHGHDLRRGAFPLSVWDVRGGGKDTGDV